MLYLAWRQRFGKASPRTDLTNGRQEATKPFFKEMPTPKAASRNLLWNFLHRTTDSSSTGPSPLLQQPAGSPTNRPPGPRSTSHREPISRPHDPDQRIALLPARFPAIRGTALHSPSQRIASAIATRCTSPRSALPFPKWQDEDRQEAHHQPPSTALPRATPAPRPQKKRSAASRTCLYPI